MNNKHKEYKDRKAAVHRAFQAALPPTFPILAGFLFLGMTYGFYMRASGFAFWYPILMASVIFAGSMEFAAVPLLLSSFAPLSAFILALTVNARHLFYGLSLLEKYRGTGWKKPYLIFGLCDETFSINCSADLPQDVDKGWFYFFTTLLDQMYWVGGTTLGAVFGSFIHMPAQGLDFVMTAMFVVIFLSDWDKHKEHRSHLLGLAIPALCLCLFGADGFIVPSMAALLVIYGLQWTAAQNPFHLSSLRAASKKKEAANDFD